MRDVDRPGICPLAPATPSGGTLDPSLSFERAHIDMAGIFISYRRVDTLPWAGRLFDGLCRCFGKDRVFMDINGGIPRGANFETVLTGALAGCDALLALIGPRWSSCTDSGGRRRLERADDWVRTEIVTGLSRNIPVVPVLLGEAPLPQVGELPEDLQPLCKQNKADVTDADWNHHVWRLAEDIARQTSLRASNRLEIDDVDSASGGLALLSDLISADRAVADATSRSKEVIENSYRQVGRLELFKLVHDAFHTIEFECLRPLEAGGSTSRLRPFKIRFATEARRIRESIQAGDMSPALKDDILEALGETEETLQGALTAPSEAGYAGVVARLQTLVSRLPSRLDEGICDTARELSLDRLVQLLRTVRETLEGSGHQERFASIVQAIDALERLRDELDQRVKEHSQLQRLDSRLRVVCVAGIDPRAVGKEWTRIKQVRARLAPPFTPDLQAVNEDLAALEGEIDAAVTRAEDSAAWDILREYFRSVASVFRDVDRSLKDFCMRLGGVSKPLKAVLELC
jgi:hypothetical protein